MAKLIRKISVGKDYKNDAMHYAVGQEVYGGHTICDIVEEETKFSIYIKKKKDVLYTPFFWRWIMLIIRMVPERIFKKLKL